MSFSFQVGGSKWSGKSNGFFVWGGFSCNHRFVLKPDVAIASEVSNSGKSSLAIADFFAKRTQLYERPGLLL